MPRDYDAVKAAWETLIRSAPKANPTGDGDSLMQEIRRLYDENSDAPETLPESEDAFLRGFRDEGDGTGRPERLRETLAVDPDVVYPMFGEIYDNDARALAWDELIDMDLDGFHESMKRLSRKLRFKYERHKTEEVE